MLIIDGIEDRRGELLSGNMVAYCKDNPVNVQRYQKKHKYVGNATTIVVFGYCAFISNFTGVSRICTSYFKFNNVWM